MFAQRRAEVCAMPGPPVLHSLPGGYLECASGKAKENAPPDGRKTVFVLLSSQGVALRQRAAKGLLAGLWNFPMWTAGWMSLPRRSRCSAGALCLWNGWNSWKRNTFFSHVEWHMRAMCCGCGDRTQHSCAGRIEMDWKPSGRCLRPLPNSARRRRTRCPGRRKRREVVSSAPWAHAVERGRQASGPHGCPIKR